MRLARLIVLALMLLCSIPAMAQDAAQWPHTLTGPGGGSVTVYQPQAVAWPEQKTLSTRVAVAITPKDAKTPILGTIEVSFTTSVDNATRMVTLSDPKLTATHFPSLDTGQASQLEDRIRAALPSVALKQVPLETVLLGLKEQPQAAKAVAVNNDPPVIFHADRPASLVVFDGAPVLAPAGQSGLSYAVNTNWDVFTDTGSGTWYLLNNGYWFAATAATGPYQPASKLPPSFSKLPADANFADARKALPPKPINPAQAPTIFVSTKPAEIIVTQGPMQLTPIPGTSLQYVKNTASDLIFDPSNGRFYYLISGRWFASNGLDGPWTFASDKLPPDFALIPASSDMGNVLVSVPGTAQAQTAVIKAQIPQQATLKRGAATLVVTYAGTPQFQPIPGTEMTYAVNTAYQVIGYGGKYYACYQGAWFVAVTPTGPWALADSIPPAIYTIPPSSPMYNVTYVSVYGATPEAVTYGYTAGYLMGFVTAGLLVYGTGYYYPPYVAAGVVPAYFPHPYSYAGAVWYNPATGAWARGGAVYGPYGGARAGAVYNPATGGWARGAAVYGPYGGAGAWSAYNPATGTYSRGAAAYGPYGAKGTASFYNPRYGVAGTTTQNANAYARWGSSTVAGANRTVNTASVNTARGGAAGAVSSSTGAAAAGVRTPAGNTTGAVRTPSGDVYAGHDGNVYQHSSSGWSKWDNGSWQQMQRPSSTMGAGNYQQLEQDRAARFQGAPAERSWGGGAGRFGGGGRFR